MLGKIVIPAKREGWVEQGEAQHDVITGPLHVGFRKLSPTYHYNGNARPDPCVGLL